jgi:hypothetical protein
MSFSTQTANPFELAALSAPEDAYGYRARAAREGRASACEACGESGPGVSANNSTGKPLCYECGERLAEARDAQRDLDEAAEDLAAYGMSTLDAECVECGSGRKIVMTDRELLDANAVCCEGQAA